MGSAGGALVGGVLNLPPGGVAASLRPESVVQEVLGVGIEPT